jgi:hypothetical protein
LRLGLAFLRPTKAEKERAAAYWTTKKKGYADKTKTVFLWHQFIMKKIFLNFS